MSFHLLKELCAVPGIPGREEQVRSVVVRELSGISDHWYTDQMGNTFFLRKGKGIAPRKVMLAAHMDEISFIVRHIHKDGFLYFQPLGGFDPRVLLAQRVKIHGTRTIDGVIAIKAAHFTGPEERNKVIPLDELFIDTGMSFQDVSEIVKVGSAITMERECIELGNFYTSKTLDDRIGVYAMIEAFKQIKDNEDDIYAVATVQEEVGVRGAKLATFGLDPDIGIAIDITIAADTPGISEENHCVKMGKGVGLKIMDSYSISHPQLVEFMRILATEKSVAHQMEVLRSGGTDAGGMQMSRAGIPVMTLSIPSRYTHSVVECCHKEDVKNCIDLLRHFCENSGRFSVSY